MPLAYKRLFAQKGQHKNGHSLPNQNVLLLLFKLTILFIGCLTNTVQKNYILARDNS